MDRKERRKMRKERIQKCINILLLCKEPEKILEMSPEEIEYEVFNLLMKESPVFYEYVKRWGL